MRAFLAPSLALLGLTTIALAETEAEKQACMGDAFRFCATAIPNRQKVGACLTANRQQISAACRGMIDGDQGASKPRRS